MDREEVRRGQELWRKRRRELEKAGRLTPSPQSIGKMANDYAARIALKQLTGTPPEELIQECPDCGTILLPIWVPQLGEWRPGYCEECHRKRVVAEILAGWRARAIEDAGLNRGEAAHMTLENFDRQKQLEAYDRVCAWLKDWPRAGSLIFWSEGYGTGKTHLARAIQRKLIERNYTTRFWTMPEFVARIQASYNGEGSEWAIFQKAADVDLLILDDVGTEHSQSPSWRQSIYFRLIDPRYREGKPMVLTTNVPPDRLGEIVGWKCYSRLRAMAGEEGIICMNGEDYRL